MSYYSKEVSQTWREGGRDVCVEGYPDKLCTFPKSTHTHTHSHTHTHTHTLTHTHTRTYTHSHTHTRTHTHTHTHTLTSLPAGELLILRSC
jgi:hypothetical protein